MISDEYNKYIKSQCSVDTHGNRCNYMDYIYRWGNGRDAIVYSGIFLPEFVLIEDSVLLAWTFKKPSDFAQYREHLHEGDHSASRVEWLYNWVEVRYLFSNLGDNMEEEEELILAGQIERAWRGWLQVCFPDRKFVVEIMSAEESGDSTEVRFYQDRGYSFSKD